MTLEAEKDYDCDMCRNCRYRRWYYAIETEHDYVKLPDDSFVVKARVVDIEDMEPFKVHREKDGEK